VAHPRAYSQEAVDQGITLTASGLAAYVKGVTPVTDDNQLLSFGAEGLHRYNLAKRSTTAENRVIIDQFRDVKVSPSSGNTLPAAVVP
jgi:hypothetical protein